MMGPNSGPAWTGTALTVFGLMSTVNAFIYNETLDPWNMNKNQGECRMPVGLSRRFGLIQVGGEVLMGFGHTSFVFGIDAKTVLEYTTTPHSNYTPSPDNWRVSHHVFLLPLCLDPISSC